MCVHYLCQAPLLDQGQVQREGREVRGSRRGESGERGSSLNASEAGSFLSVGRAQRAFCPECALASTALIRSQLHQPLTSVRHTEH